MRTRLEQRSWIKIEVARARSAQECFQRLHEACGDAALPCAYWHDELKRSGRAGMPFRTTSVQDDPTWRTTQFNSLLPCWMLIADALRVS